MSDSLKKKLLVRFATIFIENLYPDIVIAKRKELLQDPYGVVEDFIDKNKEGIRFVEENGRLFLDIYPYGERIRTLITKDLVKETLFAFEVSLNNFTVIEEIPLDVILEKGSYENKEADWFISSPGSSPGEEIIQFIVFNNRSIVEALDSLDDEEFNKW